MTSPFRCMLKPILGAMLAVGTLAAQSPLTWDEVTEHFKKNNPNRLAGELFVQEFRANETTVGFRPNPILTSTEDQNSLFSTNPYRPLGAIQWTQAVSQLIERRNKRQLRVESARLAPPFLKQI